MGKGMSIFAPRSVGNHHGDSFNPVDAGRPQGRDRSDQNHARVNIWFADRAGAGHDGLGLAITEGIEDGLSVFEETGLGVWAAGSAGNMPKIAAALPPYIECTTIFAHRDETGLRFAKEAARLIAAMKVEVHVKGRG
jgi:hypothetical protein